MSKRNTAIPVNTFSLGVDAGVSIERFSSDDLPDLDDWSQPERHDRHTCFLIETGSVNIEIDFKNYEIIAPALIYMHPDQVHRIFGFVNVTCSAWAITNEKLQPEYLKLLEDFLPAGPVALSAKRFNLFTDAVTLGLKFSELQGQPIYRNLLAGHCNTLVALLISTYAESSPAGPQSGAELVAKSFRTVLAAHFTHCKRPAQFAEKLNISAAYLNECVKQVTGQPVTYHIQQRVVLEAKRLLVHSGQSLKEIAALLGYDDYAYFSRLFTKVAGVSPVQFRHKNLD